MDMAAIGAAVTSLRAAGDVAKGLISLHTMAEVQSKAIDLNQKIIDAQHQIFEANATQTALVERIRDLEGQITRMKDWDAQKQRYKLVAPFSGCMVYALQKAMSDGEPPHYLCAACFQKGQRSILQAQETGQRRKKDSIGHSYSIYACPECKAEATTEYISAVKPEFAEDIK